MKKSGWKCFFPGFVLLLAILTFSTAWAQSDNNIRITMVSTLETPESMIVKVYFNLYDARSGTPILNLNATSAQVTLLNTNYKVDGILKQPDVPIYVTLVLDSSGSMASSVTKLQEAARLALNNTPDNSLFAVVQFDEEIKLLQDFTQNIPAASYAIDQYKASNRGTCLYDAAYSAVEAQGKVPVGRRAVILFTDGKDEKRDGSICSKHTYQELVTLATNMQVPIHTIGLSDQEAKINALELQSMSTSTGGFSYVSTRADLAQAFTSIMEALKAQWMVEAVVYPRKGNNDALLTLGLQGDTSINSTFTIRSETDYPGPPVPVSAKFAGLVFNYLEETFDIQVTVTSPELVGYIKATVWDRRAGSKVEEFVFDKVESFNTFQLSTSKLDPGREYDLRLVVVNSADQVPFAAFLADQDKRSSEYIHEFTFDPTSTYPEVEVQTVVQQGNNLAVTVSTKNRQWVTRLEGWLVNETTNTKEVGSDFNITSVDQDVENIIIPLELNQVPDGKYSVIVRVLGKENQIFSTAEYKGVVYKATREGLSSKVVRALLANVAILFSILGIILALVLFFMINSLRSKSLSGTPVMQGRLGGGLKGSRKGGSNLPLADAEPIPSAAPAGRKPAPPKPTGQNVPNRAAQPQVQNMDATRVHIQDRDNQTLVSGLASPDSTLVTARPQEKTPMLTLVTVPGSPELQGRRIILDKWPYIVGRHESTLVLQEASLSRRHLQISYERTSQMYYVSDLNSSNGSRLNGQPLVAGQAYPVSSGASLQLGPNVVIRFDLV